VLIELQHSTYIKEFRALTKLSGIGRASHVSAKTGVAWRYLLVGESDIAAARGSWTALRALARA
jgi:hypothetical protein